MEGYIKGHGEMKLFFFLCYDIQFVGDHPLHIEPGKPDAKDQADPERSHDKPMNFVFTHLTYLLRRMKETIFLLLS
jgi:hypothetical protein